MADPVTVEVVKEQITSPEVPVPQSLETVDKPKPSFLWLKNKNGEPSASLTFVTIAFWVTTLSYIISIFESLGPVSIRAFDPAACASFLAPICALYFGRKYTDTVQK